MLLLLKGLDLGKDDGETDRQKRKKKEEEENDDNSREERGKEGRFFPVSALQCSIYLCSIKQPSHPSLPFFFSFS